MQTSTDHKFRCGTCGTGFPTRDAREGHFDQTGHGDRRRQAARTGQTSRPVYGTVVARTADTVTVANGFGGTSTRRTSSKLAGGPKPASDGSIRLLTALARGGYTAKGVDDVEGLTESYVAAHVTGGQRSVSAAIDKAKAAGVRPVWEPVGDRPMPGVPAPRVELVHGQVYVDNAGRFVKAADGANGFYGKVWDGTTWEFVRGCLRTIVRPLNAEEAAAWGHEHERCIFCSRKLADERENHSVQVGYGPVCAEKYGLPWG